MNPIATLGAGCLLIEDDRILLVQPNYGPAKGHWVLPGGFVESGEQPETCAIRELFEETGQRGGVESPLCVRYRLAPADVYWVFRMRRFHASTVTAQESELQDARFWPLAEALTSEVVRPMTRYFIEAAVHHPMERKAILLPEAYAETNWVYFLE